MNILMLHGINHNMFGKRDPKQYGTVTLDEIDAQLRALGQELGDVAHARRETAGALAPVVHGSSTSLVRRLTHCFMLKTWLASVRRSIRAAVR